jgi:hypothetical protein
MAGNNWQQDKGGERAYESTNREHNRSRQRTNDELGDTGNRLALGWRIRHG